MMSADKKRFYFIDQFRGWAVLLMIETHVLNAFLNANLRSSLSYRVLDFINGLVAPAFLFVAGFAFAIVAMRKWDEYLHLGRPFWQQFRRYLFVGLVGYLLHLPGFSLPYLIATLHWNEPNGFWGVDVLHCIALSLLLMLLLVPLLRRQKLFFIFLALAALAVVLLTRLVYSLDIAALLPAALAGYIKRIPGSQFPLFPWLAYVWLGAFFSWLWQEAKRSEREIKYFRDVSITGGLLVVIFFIVVLQPIFKVDLSSFSPSRPLFFFLKLALILLLLACAWHREQKWGKRPAPVTTVGQESLLVYAAHLAVIYGTLWPSLSFLIGKTRSWLEVAVMALVLIAAMFALALAWHRFKTTRPAAAKRVFWVGAFVLFVIMLWRT
jgi:uncharacterized membrane protein